MCVHRRPPLEGSLPPSYAPRVLAFKLDLDAFLYLHRSCPCQSGQPSELFIFLIGAFVGLALGPGEIRTRRTAAPPAAAAHILRTGRTRGALLCAARNPARSAGRTRIVSMIRTCGSAARLHSL